METEFDKIMRKAVEDEIQEQLDKDRREIISAIISSSLWSALTLGKVIRHSRRGNYQAATMWAVLFGAFSTNYNAAGVERRARMGDLRYNNALKTLFKR